LRLLAQGFIKRVIAGQLHLAEGTVMKTILHKVGASDHTQAVLNARRAKPGIVAGVFLVAARVCYNE
jgi:DNA-binding NarL/FixJ family response regulator